MNEHPLHQALAVFLQDLPSHPQLISPSLVLDEAREPDHWDRLGNA